MKPDPNIAADMHRQAAEHESKNKNPAGDWNKFLYKELVKIRKWITFIGIVLILGIIGAILSMVP